MGPVDRPAVAPDTTAPFFASDDDLRQRVKLPQWQDFLSFLISPLGASVQGANAEAWAGQISKLQVGLQGIWFRISRGGAYHD